MTKRTQIGKRDRTPGARLQRRPQEADRAQAGSPRDEMLALQRSAGNSAVTARMARRTATGDAVQRAPDGAVIDPAPAGPANVFRAGFFSNIWKKVKGFFSKPKTGKPVEGATTEGGTSTPQMTVPTQETEEESTGGTSEGSGDIYEGESSSNGGSSGPTEKETTPGESGPIAPETTKTEPEHPSPPPLAMDLASGETVLKNAFGSMKTIVPGKIEVLAPVAFKEAYDKIYGSGQWSWDRYVVPTYGGLNGFAYDGVNYINTGSAGLHTVVHEMLHNNCASDWIPFVGSRFNEGTTEILTQVACAKLSVDAPVCYPGESPCVQAALDAGLPLADLEAAYLNGGAKEKIGDWVDANCKETWAQVKVHMEAKDWAAAKAGLAKK